jgi:hypothetical protein
MSKGHCVNNSRYRKESRRKSAVERQEYRNNLSAKKQLERLDARLEGTNVGAVKERARLNKLLAQSN